MPFDPRGVVVLVVDVLLLAVVIARPMSRQRDQCDVGDGTLRVILPPPNRRSPWRTASIIVIYAALCAGILGLRNPDLSRAYVNLLELCVGAVVPNPALVTQYLDHVPATIELVIAAFILAISLAVPASPLRRLVAAFNVVLFLAAILAAQTILASIGLITGAPVGPFTFEATVVNLVVGFVILTRLKFTTFQLPRVTTVARVRPSYRADKILFLLAAVAALAASGAIAMVIGDRLQLDAAMLVIVGLVVAPYLWILIGVLGLLEILAPKAPAPGSYRSPIDVIIPAYNEETGIAITLRCIDQAAATYGAPVHVILADDGSTDHTAELSRAIMAGFIAATGEVLACSHAGKSRALNCALARCTAEVVVRIDADCGCGPEALLYAARWFTLPQVGSVGALTFPLRHLNGWLRHMRRLECLMSFGLLRYALQAVDGINCIPGTFTAFRREPVVASIGGFVEGMNGEDADLTMQLGRLGYRAVIDHRVESFEDSPGTVREMRSQRIRWYRAGLQVLARHNPFGAGLCGVRTWFTMPRNQRLNLSLRLALVIYLIELGVIRSSFRDPLLLLAVVYLVGRLPVLTLAALLSVRFGYVRSLLWLPMWVPFNLLKAWFGVEAMLSLPSRPVPALRDWLPRGRSRRDESVASAAILG